MGKKGLLERLREGPVVGDGGFTIALEKRGYVLAGKWTAEASVEHPEAVKQLHREFLRAGSDVMQTYTFFSTDDKLAVEVEGVTKKFTCREINVAGCRLAREVAAEGDALVAGGFSHTLSYNEGKAAVQALVREQLQVFVDNKVDFIIAELFYHIEEMEWAIEEALKTGLVVVATMGIGEKGDENGVSPGECAVRMAKAGAQVVGVNCIFDPDTTIKTIRLMKEALDAAGLKPFLMTQPNGFHCPGTGKSGYNACPEYPFALEPRTVTRADVHRYAREAYDLGVRYIGGCCGFEPYHIRAIAEELSEERGGKLPPASAKHRPWGGALVNSGRANVRARANRQHWETLVPSSGRSQPPSHPLDPLPEDD